ncbi:MAG: tripartite tricarboxylate transporter substrate binding protein [Acetobacteraceae bacterium]|nr:tripartite tricarboxylate transporter substrate binding protein [Acetobacteraceae bacterium]
MHRRALLAAPLLAPGLAAAQAAWTPDRPIRLLVPFAAGGPTDVVARLMADALAARFPQRVVVENRAGGGTIPAAEAVARAPKDGTTLLFTTVTHAVLRALHGRALPFDPLVDFAPVALVGVVPMVILVRPDAPVRDVPELLALLRREPGRHSYGSSGAGGSSHLGVELLKAMTGTDISHIPYRGTAPAVADLLGGRVLLVMDSVATGAAQVRQGALRGLATTAERPSAALPDLPTVAAAVPGFAATTWNAVLAPAGTPDGAVAAVSAALAEAARRPDIAARLLELGVEVPADMSPPATAAFIRAEAAKWEDLVARANIRAD